MSGNKKARKAVALMALTCYALAGVVLHCFHNHTACRPGNGQTVGRLDRQAECEHCSCDHGHGLHTHPDFSPAKGNAGDREDGSTAVEIGSSSTVSSSCAHCAVCRFLAQASYPPVIQQIPAVAETKPRRLSPEPNRNEWHPVHVWQSRAPPALV